MPMLEFEHYLKTNSRYQSYLYSYPHKTAYRHFEKPLELADLWKDEKKDSLYLYSHIPFCRMKCSFCNLFTVSNPQDEWIDLYLQQLQTEASVMRDILGEFNFSGYAIGGGTPSLLNPQQLAQLLSIYADTLNIDLAKTPGSFEISPETITDEKLQLLSDQGVERISIGIQSFIENEAKSVGRHLTDNLIHNALEKIVSYQFPVFNIDLIYGIPGQTAETWLTSLKTAMQYQPAEIFLYPLYIRPLTSLHKKNGIQIAETDFRDELYALGRDFLLSQGYIQDSMRLFRHQRITHTLDSDYSCQEDGMLGLGTNARSYTQNIHYSTEYAVSRPNVNAIVENYLYKPVSAFQQANYGIQLTEDDRKRRYLIKSLLKAQGVYLDDYTKNFQENLLDNFPELNSLMDLQLATKDNQKIQLTSEGMAYSDLLGHWFISDNVKTRMHEYIHK
jgi:oxygen-independent coproporphyrinogen III oxidase